MKISKIYIVAFIIVLLVLGFLIVNSNKTSKKTVYSDSNVSINTTQDLTKTPVVTTTSASKNESNKVLGTEDTNICLSIITESELKDFTMSIYKNQKPTVGGENRSLNCYFTSTNLEPISLYIESDPSNKIYNNIKNSFTNVTPEAHLGDDSFFTKIDSDKNPIWTLYLSFQDQIHVLSMPGIKSDKMMKEKMIELISRTLVHD